VAERVGAGAVHEDIDRVQVAPWTKAMAYPRSRRRRAWWLVLHVGSSFTTAGSRRCGRR
jgi:hypothetical protein